MFFMMNLDEIQSSETFIKISQLFEDKLCELEKKSKTAKLWISYFRMVSILKDFVAAERMGDWQLDCQLLELMIPFRDISHMLNPVSYTHLDVYKRQVLLQVKNPCSVNFLYSSGSIREPTCSTSCK